MAALCLAGCMTKPAPAVGEPHPAAGELHIHITSPLSVPLSDPVYRNTLPQ